MFFVHPMDYGMQIRKHEYNNGKIRNIAKIRNEAGKPPGGKTTHDLNLSLPRCGQGLSLDPAMNPRMSAFSGRVTRFAVRNISCASTICSLVSVSARRCGCPPACGRC